VGLAIMSHMQSIYHDVLGRHADLVHSRHQIDQVADQLNQLSQTAPRSIAEQKRQLANILQELDPAATSPNLLSDTSSELPGETADVQQAVAVLARTPSAADRNEDTRQELLVPSAVVHLR